MIRINPQTGTPLQRLGDRLLFCPLTGFYYISTRGKLSGPLLNPPPRLVETPEEEPAPMTRPQTKKVGKLKIPGNLIKQLTDSIGADMIPIFMRFLKEEVKMHPVRYLTQTNQVKNLIETSSFPKWLERIGAA